MGVAGRHLALGVLLLGCDVVGGPPSGVGGSADGSGASGSLGSGGAAAGPSGGASSGGAQAGGTAGTGGLPGPSGGGTFGSGGGGSGGVTASGGGQASGGSGSSGSGGAGGDPTCAAGVHEGQTPGHLELSGNTFAHDPTMIRVGDTYYRFWTGDYIPMATSTDLTDWDNAPSVYDGAYPSWVDPWLAGVPGETFNFPWAPDVSSFSGEVHIYSTFSAIFGDNVSCISHLSTPNLGQTAFTDHGPVVCTEGSEDYNAIDADVGFDDDGSPWLAFGSFWDGIMLHELDSAGTPLPGEPTNIAWAPEIEAPVLFKRCGEYYLFVSWGICCPGGDRSVDDLSYRVVVGRSDSIEGPYLDRDGSAMTDGGGTMVVEGDGITWAAAGHSDILVDGEQLYHLYHGYRQSNGAAELRIAELYFDQDGWPVPHAP